MSQYTCQGCGLDVPASKACPRCEPGTAIFRAAASIIAKLTHEVCELQLALQQEILAHGATQDLLRQAQAFGQKVQERKGEGGAPEADAANEAAG